MNYWLFQVMWNWYPGSWPAMVNAGIAVQSYPHDWSNEPRNVKSLRQLKARDFIVAAFKQHRFAGYAKLRSDFYRGGPSLKIRHRRRNLELGFQERFNCRWTVLPLDRKRPYIKCDDVKMRGDINLLHGCCVRQISKSTFQNLKRALDKAGARSFRSEDPLNGIVKTDIEAVKVEEGMEGKKTRVLRYTNRYERNPDLRVTAIRVHGTNCQVCGFNFEKVYRDRGFGYIEVHHKRPVFTFGKNVRVNPRTDMAVLCSNCHRMIHRHKDRVLSVQQLRKMVCK